VATSHEPGQYVIERVQSQRSATLIQVAALLGAVGCMALAARLQAPINQQRKELQLVMQSDIYKELPPEYGWLSAFGGTFRGLAVNYIWTRADKLKEEGKYYESLQLAKWICTLQPRFAQVWVFQAWNMSYNISVATQTAPERWQWVYNGIRLLRDEGIPNNERVVPLYHELAWIWFHKVGDRIDEFHNYYKRMWAATMETLLGPPPVGVSDAQAIAWFAPIADAPLNLDELIAQRPGVAALVEALAKLDIDVEAGTSDQRVYHPLEESFFKPYTRYMAEKNLVALRSKPFQPSESERKLDAFFASAPAEDFQALLAYLRSKVLREQYKMDPDFMLAMSRKLDPTDPVAIDWRTPWSQAIYWGLYGSAKGEQNRAAKEIDRLNTDRIVVYGLESMARGGRYVFRLNLDDPFRSFLATEPDFRYIDAMHRTYIALGKKYAEQGENVENRTCEMLESGHVNFLEDGIIALYMAGRDGQAKKYLDYLAKYYPQVGTKKPKPEYQKTLDEFVMIRLPDFMDTQASANRLINSLLYKACLAMAAGQTDEYVATLRRARELYDKYQKGATESPENRLKLPLFEQIHAGALYAFATEPSYPLYVRSSVWRGEDPGIKQHCYDYAIPGLTAECQREGLDVKRAFPEPPGMAEWRKDHPAPVLQEEESKQEKSEGGTP
jgi:hypothetical protein